MEIHKVKINNKNVFVSQSGDSFKVIKPYKNEDGSWNWFNLLTGGSWMNLIMIAVIIFVILGLLNEYTTNIRILQSQLQVCQQFNHILY